MTVRDTMMVDATGIPGEGAPGSSSGVRETIAGYVERVANERIADHSSNLFEAGLLTSLDVLSLVAFIEDAFTVEISGDDIDMDSFGTIDGLVDLITGMQRKSASP